ncbi:MAG: Flp pilus assembly protein CpaB, partial [Pseudomonadota bacterium]
MRLGFIVILLAGIGIAGLSGYLVVQQINALENQVAVARSEAAKVVPTKEVYIATKEIPYGTPITIDLVKKFTWPAQVLPEGYFENEEDLFGSDSSEQRIAVRAMQENDLILASKVTGKGEDAGIVSRLGVGLRAFVLKVDVASGAFLRPGDLVDIYWTGSDRGQLTTRLILDGVELIAINQ